MGVKSREEIIRDGVSANRDNLLMLEERLNTMRDDAKAAHEELGHAQDDFAITEPDEFVLEDGLKLLNARKEVERIEERIVRTENHIQRVQERIDALELIEEEPQNLVELERLSITFETQVWPAIVAGLEREVGRCTGSAKDPIRLQQEMPEDQDGSDYAGRCDIESVIVELEGDVTIMEFEPVNRSLNEGVDWEIFASFPDCFMCTEEQFIDRRDRWAKANGFDEGFTEFCARSGLDLERCDDTGYDEFEVSGRVLAPDIVMQRCEFFPGIFGC